MADSILGNSAAAAPYSPGGQQAGTLRALSQSLCHAMHKAGPSGASAEPSPLPCLSHEELNSAAKEICGRTGRASQWGHRAEDRQVGGRDL